MKCVIVVAEICFEKKVKQKQKKGYPANCPMCGTFDREKRFPDVEKGKLYNLTLQSPNPFHPEKTLKTHQLLYIAEFWMAMLTLNEKLKVSDKTQNWLEAREKFRESFVNE